MKKQIEDAFIAALKSKDLVQKRALSNLKAAVKNFEISKQIQDISDSDFYALVAKQIKDRTEGVNTYRSNNREDLAILEEEELMVLQDYLPNQLTSEEIHKIITEVKPAIQAPNNNALKGKIMGYFSKTYPGQFDGTLLKTILDQEL